MLAQLQQQQNEQQTSMNEESIIEMKPEEDQAKVLSQHSMNDAASMKESVINIDEELEGSPQKKVMNSFKEESSFLHEQARPAKPEVQKKIIKKVRFHDEPSS